MVRQSRPHPHAVAATARRRLSRGVLPRVLLAAVMMIGVCGVAVTRAEPAQAASCFQTSCAGKNPSTAGCATTWTPREMSLHQGRYTLQLRYSAGCYAFWGRIVRDDCDLIQGFAWLRVQRQLRTPYGWSQTHRYFRIQSSIPCNGGTGWTYMVPNSTPSDDRFRACHSGAVASSHTGVPESSWTCTSWLQF